MPRARPGGGEIGCLRAGGRSRAAGFGQSHRGALIARLPARPSRSRGIRAHPRSEGMCATAWREDSFPHKEAKAGGSGWTEAPAHRFSDVRQACWPFTPADLRNSIRRYVRDCMARRLLSSQGSEGGRIGMDRSSRPSLLRRASGLLALHAGGLEELDLVARADDVFVVNPTAVDGH